MVEMGLAKMALYTIIPFWVVAGVLALFVNPERVEEEKKGNDNTIGDDAN